MHPQRPIIQQQLQQSPQQPFLHQQQPQLHHHPSHLLLPQHQSHQYQPQYQPQSYQQPYQSAYQQAYLPQYQQQHVIPPTPQPLLQQPQMVQASSSVEEAKRFLQSTNAWCDNDTPPQPPPRRRFTFCNHNVSPMNKFPPTREQQSVYSGAAAAAAAAAARNNARTTFDHQFAHHQPTDPYFSNFLMSSDNYAASQYSSMNFSNSLANNWKCFGNNSHSGSGAYSSLATQAGLSASAYPNPSSSVNQQLPSQNAAQDDSMRHFHVTSSSSNNGTSYPTNFNPSPYPPGKVSTGANNLPPSSGLMSSCMVAAAAAAAASSASSTTNSTTPNAPVNYLQHNLTPSGSDDSEVCLSNVSNLTPTISDGISNGNKMNESQLNVNVDHPVITSEPTLNSVFNGTEIEFFNLIYPLVDASAAANYAQQMRIDGTGPKKKKERSKKHKKKEKIKPIDRISMPINSNLNNLTLFPYYQTPNNSHHYHENFSNHMNQNNTFDQSQQSHHHSPASHPSTPVHQQQQSHHHSPASHPSTPVHQQQSHHHSPAPHPSTPVHQHQQSHHHSPASHPSTPVHQQQPTIYAKSSSTPYSEPSSSVNQQQLQQQQQQVPQSQQASVSQQTQLQPTGVTSALSEGQPSHLQSQPNLMSQSDLVPSVSPSCFDNTATTLNSLQSDLMNSSLSEQLNNAGSRHSNHSNHSVHSNQTNSSCDYPKSLSDTTSQQQQSMIVHHNQDNSCSVSQPPPLQHPNSSNLGTTENDNQIDNQITEKFSSIEDDLDFLTAADECESNSQVNRNEIETQIVPQIVSSNESHNIPMDQQARQHHHLLHHQQQQQLQHHHQQSQSQHVQQQQHHQQTPLSSTSIVASVQPTLITTTPSTSSSGSPPLLSVSSCMEQSKSTSTMSVCTVDPLLTNTCAISDDQLIIKSSSSPSPTTSSTSTTPTTTSINSRTSKGYQTDFIPTAQQQQQQQQQQSTRVPTSLTSDISIDINNVENKMNNEVGGNIGGSGGGSMKKKKKSKEAKTKLFCSSSSKLLQGSTSTPIINTSNKKSNSIINIVPVHNDNFNKISSQLNNKSLLSNVVTTCKPIEVTNVRKSIDSKDHEAKFFKMRPVNNTTTITTIHEPGMRLNCKSTKKRKLVVEETGKDHKSVVDEYEFPDSPTHLSTTKKVKRINLENSKKKMSDKLLTNSNNNCSITIDRKVSLKPKMKSNQNFTGNTASTKLNISDKTEIINIIGPRSTIGAGRQQINQQHGQQMNCHKLKIEEKTIKSTGSSEKKNQLHNLNNPNVHSNQPHNQRIIKDSSKVPSIIVQEIVTQPSSSTLPHHHHHQQHHHHPSSSSSTATTTTPTKNLTSTINIVSISKKSSNPGSNQSKKESPTRTCLMNNPIATNTITTIVPISANNLNTSIIIANQPTTSNLTTTTITNQQQSTSTHLPQSISTVATTTTPPPPPQPQTPSSSSLSTSITTTITPPPTSQQHQQPQSSGSLKNLTNPNVLMQSAGTNTPRRRSQDKKALTIREGLMRTGDFVVSLDETESDLPMIWRIEGKSLLQRFEPSDQDGQIVYTNTSSYSAWNPTVKQRYTGVDVRIVGCNRTKIVVEKLGLTRNNSNYDKNDPEKSLTGGSNLITNGEITVEKCKPPEDKADNSFQHQADFEVFIQTLISQALDANFISEIIKENDEYFLSHIQAIDEFCVRKKSRFFTKVKWDAHIVKCVETFSSFNVIPQSQVGDLRCRLCHDKWSTQILHFTGKTYDQVTLETKEPVDIKQTKYAACDECKEKVTLFSNLHHQKFNFFTKCRGKVEEMRGGVEDKDSPMILEECLKDIEWMQSLFKQFEVIWQSCDRIR